MRQETRDKRQKKLELRRRSLVSGLLSPVSSHGQSLLEYAVMVGLVIAAVTGMSVYAKRGLQSAVKSAADDMSPIRAQARANNILNADPTGEETQLMGIQYESGDRRDSQNSLLGVTLIRDSARNTDQESNTTFCERGCGGAQYYTDNQVSATRGALQTPNGAVAASIVETVAAEQ